MSDMPERIFAARGLYSVHKDNRWPEPTEYIRHDAPELVALVEAARLHAYADRLRSEYHALPNDHYGIGGGESPKGRAKKLWLRALNRATAATVAALTAYEGMK